MPAQHLRVLSSYRVVELRGDKPFQSLVKKFGSPDSEAPRESVGFFQSIDHAQAVCIREAPPAWQNSPRCQLCGTDFGILNRRHHCRNCGASVCSPCSPDTWPRKCLPIHYTNERETGQVRVCSYCHSAGAQFLDALKSGDVERAEDAILNGNVNVALPIPQADAYPVNLAAESGNLGLIQLLVKVHYAPLFLEKNGDVYKHIPCVTKPGESAICLAARRGHVEIVQYLHQECGVPFTLVKGEMTLQNLLQKILGNSSEEPADHGFAVVDATVQAIASAPPPLASAPPLRDEALVEAVPSEPFSAPPLATAPPLDDGGFSGSGYMGQATHSSMQQPVMAQVVSIEDPMIQKGC